MKKEEPINDFYYLNAVQVERIDGAIVCQITKRQLDKVLKERGYKIIREKR